MADLGDAAYKPLHPTYAETGQTAGPNFIDDNSDAVGECRSATDVLSLVTW